MKKYLLSIAIIAIITGCQSERKDYASSEQLTNIEQEDSLVLKDTIATPKIVKTADMRFKVKDVQQTKSHLSALIKSGGGTVIEFSINSIVEKKLKVKLSIDSLKEITSYRQEGTLIAKIPSEKLDEFTNIVSTIATFVDHQAMKMDDQSIAYLANTLKAKNRVDALNTIKETAKRKGNNVETSLYIKDDYIDKKIENMVIDNRTRYSTITLSFYQGNNIKTLVVGNDNIYDYRPGFFKRLVLNLVEGWVYFKEFILAISHLWMLAMLGFIAYFVSRYYIRLKKS